MPRRSSPARGRSLSTARGASSASRARPAAASRRSRARSSPSWASGRGSCRWTGSIWRRRSSCGSGGASGWARPTRSTRPATPRCSGACKSDEPVVYAPEFRREIEEPIAGAIAVPHGTPLVVTEGNYLLLDDDRWGPVRALLDETWYVETDEELRVQRLIQRHIEFGKTPEYARAWVMRSDERNADLVKQTAHTADVLVRL